MSGDLRYFKLNSVNLAGQDLTPIVIPVIRETDSQSPLKITFAKWFDHLFSCRIDSHQEISLTPLKLSHDKTCDRYFVELIHQPEKPIDFLLAFVNDNTPLDAELIPNDFSENSYLGSSFSYAVALAIQMIKAHHHRTLEKGKSYVIGRYQDCQIILNDPCVSRHHARIDVEKDGKITITDLGSTNGTFVNGKRISGFRSINEGDSVRFGKTTRKFSVKADD